MKHISKMFLIIFVTIITLTTISFASNVEDNEAPVINKITVNRNTVSAGEKLKFNFNTTDNLAGTGSIMVEWVLEGTDGKNENQLIMRVENIKNDIWDFEYTIPEKTLGGKWKVSAIQIWDNNWKLRTYRPGGELSLSNLDLTINSDYVIGDKVAPILKNINIVSSTYNAPGKVMLEADITDNISEIVKAEIFYSTEKPKRRCK